MLKHRAVEQQVWTSGQNGEVLYTPIARTDAMGEAEIEDYLDHAVVPLIGRVSYQERQAERARLRALLEAEIVAYEELGHPRPQSVALTLSNRALPNVSVPSDVVASTESIEHHAEIGIEAGRTTLHTALAGYITILVATVVALLATGQLANMDRVLSLWMLSLLMFWLPMFAGTVTGMHSKRGKPYLAIAIVCATIAVPLFIFYTAWSQIQNFDNEFDVAWRITAFHLIASLLAGWFGVTIGKVIQKRRQIRGARVRISRSA